MQRPSKKKVVKNQLQQRSEAEDLNFSHLRQMMKLMLREKIQMWKG